MHGSDNRSLLIDRCNQSWNRSARMGNRRAAGLLFQISPPSIERFQKFLRSFHLRVSSHQARSVADNLVIFKLIAFGLQFEFGVGDALLDSVIFARFQV